MINNHPVHNHNAEVLIGTTPVYFIRFSIFTRRLGTPKQNLRFCFGYNYFMDFMIDVNNNCLSCK